MPSSADVLSHDLDYYAVLDVDPDATFDELRIAFRRAVLRHHPDRSDASSSLATRRTSLLNRAWSELRDPGRRRAYDGALIRGDAATVAWPLSPGEALPAGARATRRTRKRREPPGPSPWHQPAWRSVAGFRVPAAVFLDQPDAQRRWIVEHYIEGQDWRDHRERYWLRFVADYYRDRGRNEDWVGVLERLVEIDKSFETLVRADLRTAYLATDRHLAGASFLGEVGERWAPGSVPRAWLEREERALLADFRDRYVRRGTDRANQADLLLDYLASLDLEPTPTDLRAAYAAFRRAGRTDAAGALFDRLLAIPVTDGDGWYTRVQLLTEAGSLDAASALLAEIARGEHPAALDGRRLRGQPSIRIARARDRLVRAKRRMEPAASRRSAQG